MNSSDCIIPEARYKLFKGFATSGSYSTISEAKMNAPNEDGVYNLIEIDGPYRDSWLIINGHIIR